MVSNDRFPANLILKIEYGNASMCNLTVLEHNEVLIEKKLRRCQKHYSINPLIIRNSCNRETFIKY